MLALTVGLTFLEYCVDSVMWLMTQHYEAVFYVFVMKLKWARFCSSLDLVAKHLGFMIAVIHFNFLWFPTPYFYLYLVYIWFFF